MVEAYRGEDEENWDYSDLEAIYLATVGTWRIGFPVKKDRISSTHLPAKKKEALIALLDELERKTLAGAYAHSEHQEKMEMGMFGVAKASMKSISKPDVKRLINLFLDVLQATDERAVSLVAEAMNGGDIKDFKTGKLSTILFCLRPTVFPIINGNQGIGSSVFELLGIPIVDVASTAKYAGNTREIALFRDEHFAFKNYRVFDLAGFSLKKNEEATNNDRSYWLLIANTKIWKFSELEIGGEQSYSFKNDKGNWRQMPKNFKAAKPGDLFIGFEGKPVISFVAFGEISRILEGEEVFSSKKETSRTRCQRRSQSRTPSLPN